MLLDIYQKNVIKDISKIIDMNNVTKNVPKVICTRKIYQK